MSKKENLSGILGEKAISHAAGENGSGGVEQRPASRLKKALIAGAVALVIVAGGYQIAENRAAAAEAQIDPANEIKSWDDLVRKLDNLDEWIIEQTTGRSFRK